MTAGTPDPPSPNIRRRVLLGAAIVGLVALVAAVVVEAFLLSDQQGQLRSVRRATASLRTDQADAAKKSEAALSAARSQLSALAAQLTSAQNRLKADEQQLQLTTAQLPPDVVKLAEAVSPSVVLVGCGDGLGTGFALALPLTPGYRSVVVTAEHVVDACVSKPTDISVTHEGKSVPVRLRGVDPSEDVALLDVGTAIPALQPAAGPPVTGAFVLAVGNPLGITNNVTQGNVSQVQADYFLNTAPISNGNSGGPIVDNSGRVLGIADASAVANENQPVVENLNYALRLSSLCSRLLSGSVCSTLH